MIIKRIIILGGYGNFGKRIVKNLLNYNNCELFVCGRNLTKARVLCETLSQSTTVAKLTPCQLDINSPDFASRLSELKPFLVIHTCGPFQHQDYRVPLACAEARCHYIDLADDRRFVCDFDSLNSIALEKKLFWVSGASSVPGLSSVVINHFLPKFSAIDDVEIAIAPGNRAERGLATVAAILSYTGHPISVFQNGEWQTQYGWMSARRVNFRGSVGKRWLANVDVPDLELFPKFFKVKNKVTFQAGLELSILHLGMVFMAALAKNKLIKNWQKWARPIVKMSDYFLPFGTDKGSMQVKISGQSTQQTPLKYTWTLYAENGIGPFIPTFSACILAKKLIEDELTAYGAMPCINLYQLEDFDEMAVPYNIYHQTHQHS